MKVAYLEESRSVSISWAEMFPTVLDGDGAQNLLLIRVSTCTPQVTQLSRQSRIVVSNRMNRVVVCFFII